MTFITTALAAAAVAAMASPALAAAPAFEAFASVCGETHVDYPAVVSAANSQGWKTVNAQSDTLPGATASESMSRAKSVGGRDLTLFAWRGSKGNIALSECRVSVSRGKFDALQEAAQSWAGFAAQATTPKKATFLFTEDGGVRKPVPDAEQETAAAGTGLQMMTVTAAQGGVIVGILKIKK